MQISVVLCTYNGERFLRPQLDSVLAQTAPVHEILISDDGSTDGTLAIVQEYAAHHPHIRLIQGPRRGINANFFSAMRQATGQLLALCDQDDIWEPDKLALQLEAMGDAWLCSGRSTPFSEDGYPVHHDTRRPNYHILRVAYLGALAGHTFLLRRELLDYLPDGADCPYLYDWQLQLCAAAMERIAYVDQTLVHFRRHANAATATAPTSNRKLSLAALRYVGLTLFRHRALQGFVRKRFMVIAAMLDRWNFATEAARQCRQMAQLQLERGPVALWRRMRFFHRHAEHLFYATERRTLLTRLRALYYPFACGYYYRGRLKTK